MEAPYCNFLTERGTGLRVTVHPPGLTVAESVGRHAGQKETSRVPHTFDQYSDL